MQTRNNVFHLPIEADSLYLRVTRGCSYNRCTFCGTYKDVPFRARKYEQIEAEVEKVCLKYRDDVIRVFLGDGDAMVAETSLLRKSLHLFHASFPNLKQTGIYATPASILGKTENELKGLKKAGLQNVYMGVESGSDRILEALNKGATSSEFLKASRKTMNAGLALSALAMLGAGGRRAWREHSKSLAGLLSEMNPGRIIMLTLVLVPDTSIYAAVRKGEYTTPTPVESVLELKELISGLEVTDTVFKSSHSSNYLKVSGNLPGDKQEMLHKLERVLNNPTEDFFSPEYFRGP